MNPCARVAWRTLRMRSCSCIAIARHLHLCPRPCGSEGPASAPARSAGATAIGALYCLAERDGLLFSGGYDQLVRVWDYRMMRCINELAGHTGAVRTLAVHNNRLLSGSIDGTVRLWDNFLGVPSAS